MTQLRQDKGISTKENSVPACQLVCSSYHKGSEIISMSPLSKRYLGPSKLEYIVLACKIACSGNDVFLERTTMSPWSHRYLYIPSFLRVFVHQLMCKGLSSWSHKNLYFLDLTLLSQDMGLNMQKYSEHSCLVACSVLRLQEVLKKDQRIALIQ